MKIIKEMLKIAIIVIVSAKSDTTLGQATQSNNAFSGGTPYVGWDATSNYPINIWQKNTTNPNPINFYTNNSQHASIDVNGNFTIGLTNSNNYFGIGSNTPILWHNGDNTSIFVGQNAGNNGMSGNLYHTLVGNGAGYNLTTMQEATFIGFQAGYSASTFFNNQTGRLPGNVAVGFQALYSNPDLLYNTAIGYQSLYSSSSCTLC